MHLPLTQHCKATTRQQKFILKKNGETSPHICQDGYQENKTKQTKAGMGKEKLESLRTAGSNKKLPACYEKQQGDFSEN